MHRAVAAAGLLLCVLAGRTLAAGFSAPEPVVILGYDGEAMEPFISRDDKLLFFNNRNDPAVDTNLHWAAAVDAQVFQYRGEVEGVNTPALEGVPSLDRDGNFYFISPRAYAETGATVYRGRFQDGRVSEVEAVPGLAQSRPGIVTFDAEISADGSMLYGAEGDLRGGAPSWARLFVALREGAGFRLAPDSAQLLAKVNADRQQYAPSISADGLELYYTRLTGILFWRQPQIVRATRLAPTVPFGPPEPIASITGFAEAPSISTDGKRLYFHRSVGGRFRIFLATRNDAG